MVQLGPTSAWYWYVHVPAAGLSMKLIPGTGTNPALLTLNDHAVTCDPLRVHRVLQIEPPTGPLTESAWFPCKCTSPPRVVSAGKVATAVHTFGDESTYPAGFRATTPRPFGALTAS